MAEESKIDEPHEHLPVSASSTGAALGKQPAAESDDDDEVEDAGEPAEAGGKKKISKRKKIKEAISGKPVDKQAALRDAIAKLPQGQLVELLKQNPALSNELSKANAEGSAGGPNTDAVINALKQLSLADIMTGLSSGGKNAKDMASYKFWQTQPVPKFGDDSKKGLIEEGPIKKQTVDEISKNPPKLPEAFMWDIVDLTDPEQLKEVYELLNGHYVEDDSAQFRFKYSPSILKWYVSAALGKLVSPFTDTP
jgi:glycylpeptide N-tetradecanoyltransferase